jgi:hypothetical protein
MAVRDGVVMLADIPIVSDVVGEVVDSTVGWAWDKVTAGIASWVLGAVGDLVDGALNFLKTAARPNVEAAWFSGAGSPYATVRNLAGLLMLGFVFLAIIQGLIAGDPATMLRRVATDVPTAVFGMVTTVTVAAKLLELTDALSTGVLAASDGQAVHFLSGFGAAVTGATSGFAAVLVGLVAVVAALLLWVELMIRSVLVYLLVAVSPLGFAAMVWPTARPVLRRIVELLIAVIVSKLVVSIALAVGVAALSGAWTAAPAGSGVGVGAAESLGGLLVGTAILCMAAFAPFLVLRLVPLAEAALVAHGVSRAPVRTAHASASNVYYAQSLKRLAGTGGGGSAASGWVSGAPVPAAGPAGIAAAAGAATVTGGARRVRGSIEQTTQRAPSGDRGSDRSRRSGPDAGRDR